MTQPLVAEFAVRTVGLGLREGRRHVLQHVDLAVGRGEIAALIGTNDAGTSSLLAILASTLKPTSGRAFVLGRNVAKSPVAVRRAVGYVPEGGGVDLRVTVAEHLRFLAALSKVRRREVPAVIDDLLELLDLTDHRTAWVSGLSRGLRQRVRLAGALVHDPEVLLLDDPAAGLDQRSRDDLVVVLDGLRAAGKTIVVATHQIGDIAGVATSVVALDGGRVVTRGPLTAPGDLEHVAQLTAAGDAAGPDGFGSLGFAPDESAEEPADEPPGGRARDDLDDPDGWGPALELDGTGAP